MRTPTQVKAGGIYLEHGIPDEYYAFVGGEISLTVERNGGINTIKALDILRHEGKLYPDVCPTPPIIQKESCKRGPLYGPGIQFISTNRQPNGRAGRNLFHVPDRMELYPFGFISESERFGHRMRYDLCIDGSAVLFRFTNAFPTRERFVATLDKGHVRSGEMGSQKDKVKEWAINFEGVKAAPRPFPDNYRMTLTWDFIGSDTETGAFVMDGRMQFSYGEKKVVVMVAGSRPLEVQELKTGYTMSCPWDRTAGSDEIRLCLVVAETREDARRRAADKNRRFDEICARRIEENVAYALKAPVVRIDGAPHAAEYARLAPAFLRAQLLAENNGELCSRAGHKYGFCAIWDHIYPVKAYLIMGDYETARKLLRYMLTFEPMESMVYMLMQLIVQTEELAGCSGDRQFLKAHYGAIKSYFLFLRERADPVTGLVAYVNGLGADDPGQIGVKKGGHVWFACLSGWWYDACRAMENMAMLEGDRETEEMARAVSCRLNERYLEVFYDPEKGYLHSWVEPKSRLTAGVYQNVSTLALDYPYGEYLFRKRLREIAEYQAYALCHPAGRSSVAYDDSADEMWKNAIMWIHLAHEAKAARAAGLGDEALRIVNNFLNKFDRCKVAVETHNISGLDGDTLQRADWYPLSARAGYGAIVEGIVGIQWDLGGFHYVPCAIEGDMALRDFRFRNTRWNIAISGEGPYVRHFAVDGVRLRGTLRVPVELLEDGRFHSLEIVRSQVPFSEPTLLSAVGAAVTDIEAGFDTLSFAARDGAHASIKVMAPARLSARAAGRPVAVEWDETNMTGWCDAVLQAGERIEFTKEERS
ncbi:MAG: hypothetical protein PHR35_16320 [Kiritimatiellae bacterium]|nr:hypothetical protein [Kiritimatiellia bacterium]